MDPQKIEALLHEVRDGRTAGGRSAGAPARHALRRPRLRQARPPPRPAHRHARSDLRSRQNTGAGGADLRAHGRGRRQRAGHAGLSRMRGSRARRRASRRSSTKPPAASPWTQTPAPPGKGTIAVVCAGTSDLPVAEEAAVTARLMGNTVELIADVGVAGIHRLLAQQHIAAVRARAHRLRRHGRRICPPWSAAWSTRRSSPCPPASAMAPSFGGVAALLGMLNTCSPNVCVVNIDNGFGAACIASLINRV